MTMSVSQWGNYMGLHPYHLMQLSNTLIPLNSKCSGLVYEHSWQNADRAGRVQIRQAIEEAERRWHQYSRLWPYPRFVEETITGPFWTRGNLAGQWLNVQLSSAEILALGPAVETDNATEALVYTDEDGDGLYETATATATVTAGTTADQVVARFLAVDCGPVEPPEIVPRDVSVSGVNATLVFWTYDLVRPVRYQGVASATLDPGNGAAPGATVCAPSIEVFRRRADPAGTTLDTAMAVLTWETTPYPFWAWCCSGSSASSDPAATAQAIARAVIRDARTGEVGFGGASYNATTSTWSAVCDWTHCRPPDRVTIRYQSGGVRDDRIFAQFAAAELDRGVCACDGANHAIYDAQKDLSQTGATDDLYQAPEDFANPLGSRRGQILAWRHLSHQQRLVGLYGG